MNKNISLSPFPAVLPGPKDIAHRYANLHSFINSTVSRCKLCKSSYVSSALEMDEFQISARLESFKDFTVTLTSKAPSNLILQILHSPYYCLLCSNPILHLCESELFICLFACNASFTLQSGFCCCTSWINAAVSVLKKSTN